MYRQNTSEFNLSQVSTGLITVSTHDRRPYWRSRGALESLTGAAWDLVVAAPGPVGLATCARHLFGGEPETFVAEVVSARACRVIGCHHASVQWSCWHAARHSWGNRERTQLILISTRNTVNKRDVVWQKNLDLLSIHAPVDAKIVQIFMSLTQYLNRIWVRWRRATVTTQFLTIHLFIAYILFIHLYLHQYNII